MSEEIVPKFKFIHDTASDIDAFDGGHKKVADAIFDFIETNDGGITIGLEGKWGSGKSTIVELIKQNYQEKNLENETHKRLIFVFDAWAHENDPLRRTFLTSLLNFLGINGWLDNKDDESINKTSFVTKTINELRGKTSKSKTISRPSISVIGGIAAFTTLFFFPVGLALFGEKVSTVCTSQPCGGLNWGFILSIVLMSSPVLATLISSLIINWKENKKFGLNLQSENFLANFVTKDATTRIHTDTFETPNPTSVEFEGVFVKIFDNLLIEKEDDWKLILVLDNLDRVHPDDSKAMLSALQTFLQYQQRKVKRACFQKVWTIIPYDPEGMRKVWEEIDRKDRRIGNYGRRMLEKRFQVRFFTPPIVFTGWKRYMLAKLNEAFPTPTKFDDRRDEIFDSIYNIFNFFIEWWSNHKQNTKNGGIDETDVLPISPRDLIIFINQIGTYYQQWGTVGEKVRLEDIAIFVLLRTKYPQINIPDLLSSNQEREKLPIIICNLYLKNEFDWKGDFAILWFNVERRKAKVLLVQDDVIAALSEANIEKLNKINAENIGISDVIQSIIISGSLTSKFQTRDDYLRSIHTIYNSDLVSELKGKKWVIRRLLNIFNGEYHESFNITNAEYLISLWNLFIEFNLDSIFLENVKSEFHSLVFTSQKSDLETPFLVIDGWVNGLLHLHETLSFDHFAQLSLAEEKFPFYNDTEKEDPNDVSTRTASLIYSWGKFEEIPEAIQGIFIPEDNIEEFNPDIHFSRIVESEVFTPASEDILNYPIFTEPNQVLNSIKEAKVIFPEIKFPETILSAVKLLRDFRMHIEDFPTKEHVIQIFQLIYEIAGVDLMAESFDRGPEDNNLLLAYYGHILKMCEEEQESFDIRFLGLLLLIILLSNNDLVVSDRGLATQAREFIVDELLTDPLSHQKILEAFCEAYLESEDGQKSKCLAGLPNVTSSSYGFVWLCTLSMLDALDEDQRPFLLNYLVNNWKKYIDQIDEVHREKIIEDVIHCGYLDDLFKIALETKNESSFSFLSFLSKSQEFKNNHKLKLLGFLNTYDTSVWEEILILQEAVELLKSLKEKFPRLQLTEKFSVALQSIANKMLSDEVQIPNELSLYWDSLIKMLPDLETFDKDLYTNYKRKNMQIANANFFDFFGSNLISQSNFENNADLIISDLIKPQLLTYPVKSGNHVLSLFKQIGKRKLNQIIDNEIELATLRQEMENKIDTKALSPAALEIFNQIIEYLPSTHKQYDSENS